MKAWWRIHGRSMAAALMALAAAFTALHAQSTLPAQVASTQPATTTTPATTEAATGPAATAPAVTAATLSDEQVVASMKRGIDFLLSIKNTDNWESGEHWQRNGQHGGETALVLYALLHAGESLREDLDYGPKLSYRDKGLAPVIEWLCKVNPQETYTAAFMANALALVPTTAEDQSAAGPRAALLRAQRFLVSAMGPVGGYTYGHPDSRVMTLEEPIGDLSNAQYGALGMWALAEAGFPTAPHYWQVTDHFWRALQKQNGSWGYSAGWAPNFTIDRDSMGVAGVATLFIAQEFVDRTLRVTPRPDPGIDAGLAWLNQNFKPDAGDLYYLYGVERVGLASGLKFFGTADWYRQGAADIIAHQHPDGSWDQLSWDKGAFIGATPTTATAYALLFLARGRNPILFNKLQYNGPWNARPRDDAFLTRWMSKRYERPLNWQVVNLNVDPREWLDAPVLLITGSRDPEFTPQDIAKLRKYIESGGMIFSTSDDNSLSFTAAMRKYAAAISNGKWEMRQLPKDHILYSNDLGAQVTSTTMLFGVSNGVREVWLHSVADMGASWQLQRITSKDHFEIPAALYAYATGKMPLRPSLKTLGITPPEVPPDRKLSLARITYGGNADPEPGAWPRLAELLAAEGKENGIDLAIKPCAIVDLDPQTFPIAHMTGTAKFMIKPEDVDALRKYLDGGGLLIADAAGGSEAFTDTFHELMREVYLDAKAAPLPPDHPIFLGDFGPAGQGQKLEEISLRKYAAAVKGKRPSDAALEAVTVNGRVRILFSPFDITSGLLGTDTWGIVGYAPKSAQALAENILRWGMEQQKAN